MVTLKDISRETGKSVTQVSRALAGHDDVKPETRALIKQTAQRLGYRPNLVARGLKTGRSGLVAMVVPGQIDASARENMFEMVTGISAEVSRQGMKFILHVCQPGEDELRAHEMLYHSGGVDGFVVFLSVRDDPRVAGLLAQNIPFVVHGCDPNVAHPGVDMDNIAVARAAGDCLVARGHDRVAFLNGPSELHFAIDRARGLQEALGAGPRPVRLEIDHGEMTVERGRRVGLDLMQRPDRPTAIVAANTMLAKGLYQAAAERGLSIPDDLSVLAHDDGLEHYPAADFDPPLGGTRATHQEAWSRVAALLDEAICAGPRAVGKIEVPFRFDPAGSVGPAAGQA